MKLKIPALFTVPLCLCWIAASASTITATWTNTSGSVFGTGSNWDTTPLAPGADDIAIFDGPPTLFPDVTVNSSHTVERIEFRNTDSNLLIDLEGNSLTVDNTGPGPASFILAPNSGNIATVKMRGNIAGSVVNVDHLTEIGNSGTGSLIIQESPLFFTTKDLNVGVNSMGDGYLEIRDGAVFNVNNNLSSN